MGRQQSKIVSSSTAGLKCKYSGINKTSLLSFLPRTWATTNRRGKPGKSIILTQSITNPSILLPLVERAEESNPFPPKKRDIFELVVADLESNPLPPSDRFTNTTRQIIIPETHHVLDLTKGKAVGSRCMLAGALTQKRYVCSTCDKEFLSHYALGGHRSNHVKKENMLRRLNNPHWHNREVVHECQWCKRTFPKQQGLAAHNRFCRQKREVVSVIENPMPIVVRDFDLNQLPPEALSIEGSSGDELALATVP